MARAEGKARKEADMSNVSASITQAQAEQYELFRSLGIVNVPRNTFVKLAVDRYIAELAEHALRMDQLAAILDAKEGDQ